MAKEIEDRFNAAITLLASASAEITARTGGVYSLYHLAMEESAHRTESFLILCSHIRSKTQEKTYQLHHKDRPSNEIQTAIDLLFKSQNDLEGLFPAHQAALPAADLSRTYLVGANFMRANCQKADFMDANCQAADFSHANCRQARFWHANCREAGFSFAECQEADFWHTNCQETLFWYAACQSADFRRARNTGAAVFDGATLDGAKFDDDRQS